MKPLEQIFFRACINEQIRCYELKDREFSVRVIGNIFERLGFSYKQLMYYVEKWSKRGFYDYGVTLDLGWFDFSKLNGEYKKIYQETKVTSWHDGEFAQYIVKETYRNKTITNYTLRNNLKIGKDDEFYKQ